MSWKIVFSALISVLMVAYPFLVYYGLNRFGPVTLAGVLFVLLLIRVVIKGNYHQPSQWLQLLVIGVFCSLVVIVNSEELLRYYPVLMSAGFCALFAFSLCSKTSLVERFAMMSKTEYSPKAVAYMRKLTFVWAVLLFFNAIVAAYTACCESLKVWTLYNGFIAYFILGAFVLIELVFRHFYKRRIEAED